MAFPMSSGSPFIRKLPKGWAYLVLLWWVAISGVMLMALSRHWVLEGRREREAELVFRGEQMAAAIAAYQKAGADGMFPQQLEDLLEDKRGPQVRRHLRKLWTDPITGNPSWGLMRNTQGGIQGVFSTSTLKPLSKDTLSSYQEWQFQASTQP